MLAYLAGNVGRPILWLCWPMLAYVGLILTHVEPKDPKNGNSQKNTVKRRIFWWSWAHLGAMLAYLEGNVGPSWGYVGPSCGYVGPSWSYVGPSWGYVGPSWGLCWPILRLCWPILRPMLAHVDPSWATKSETGGKMGRAQNTVKRWWGALYAGNLRWIVRVRWQKHCYLRCFVASADPIFFVADAHNRSFYVVLASTEGSGTEKLASWGSFARDGLGYR